MKKKIYTFSFLISALIISPSAAFAQQDAGANQSMSQTTVISGGGNSVNQSGKQITGQTQIKTGSACGNQIAAANQVLNQGALVLGDNNTVSQSATQQTLQRQINAALGCY
ncbi:hypothetical protein [Calothrix sp. PCC 6303]|uniref:hypothetical protein n=1 Tax=Calothrix sp. PCC 6303 TaxID=1170562 RepID=UPI0002A056E9|nr:hypothetical protein [Calothrix sp. PCC 6303]AFZ02513.1 hypothetical protein Cal6303_3588 [Calothrix sp. PCC 6303]